MFAKKNLSQKTFPSRLRASIRRDWVSHAGYAQYVDCSGSDPTAFPSITAALTTVGSGGWITIVGTCNENVAISNLSNLGLSAPWQQTATINGSISIQNSQNINLYGLNIPNPAGDGIQVGRSHGVTVDTCTSNGNAGRGLTIGPASDVTITATGAFNNNGDSGIAVNDDSSLLIIAWSGPTTASGNKNSGIYASGGSYISNLGNMTIENTWGATANGLVSGFGIDLRGDLLCRWARSSAPTPSRTITPVESLYRKMWKRPSGEDPTSSRTERSISFRTTVRSASLQASARKGRSSIAFT